MGFTSPLFLIFFIALLIIYLIVPGRLRAPLLLIGSWIFLASYGIGYLAVLLVSTLVTWVFGLALEKCESAAGARFIFAAEIVIHAAAFAFFKYNSFNILLPVGYSFYTFQAIGYLADVYRKEIRAEHGLCDFALFMAFFPKLVQGPIESGKNLLPQIHDLSAKDLRDAERIRRGALLILWGLFEKLFIADRIAIPVNAVYSQFGAFGGVEIVLVTVLYAFQIYCDFAGYTDIARGTAEILGISLTVNFRRPYLADSIQDFWRRWHISLSTWLRTYIYIPLGGNRKGRIRKYINLIITFFISGLWHGTGAHFILWGLMFGCLQVLEDLIRFRDRNIPKWAKKIITFVLVDACWMVFRANSVGDVIGMARVVLTNFCLQDFLGMELTAFEWVLLAAGILIVIIKDLVNERGISIGDFILRRNAPCRLLIYTAMIAAVVIFGVYGAGYDTSGFLYTVF